ncbi:asparagine synthase (glutamine-hydrolyzing) [Psychromicrobium sp. YIM B11713]|uniref:asparagine synthase (glutamine-hydrolyzing) n=1 Tax=Psychromicrobium sp. YIM B11713 TaxID=3145233 RepID=UPI00374F5A77
MSGVAGWVSFDRDLRQEPAPQAVKAMVETLRHRGRDDEGLWADQHALLGQCRNAVLDPIKAKQPVLNEEEGAVRQVLVYDGETYNFRQIRQQLADLGHRFRTGGDSEVVLRAHAQWGGSQPKDAVERLVGVFSYALWDTAKEELVLVRDRIGYKPLYYLPTADGVLFGSEPKAILAHSLASRVVDLDGLRRIFGFVANPGNAAFKGLREVPPAHIVRVSRHGVTEERYWALDDHEHTDDVQATVSTVRELLENAIEDQLHADVPLGNMLTGGLDSSAVTVLSAELLAKTRDTARTVAVDIDGYLGEVAPGQPRPAPDAPYILDVVDQLAAKYPGSAHVDYVLDDKLFIDPEVRSAALSARDIPALGQGDLDSLIYLLFQALGQHSKVLLSGETGDEIFAGVSSFYDPQIQQAKAFPWLARSIAPGVGGLSQGFLNLLDLGGYLDDQYAQAISEVPQRAGDSPLEARMRELNYLYLSRYLPQTFAQTDRMSSTFGVEVRLPFCDHRLVQYLFGTPWEMKTFDGLGKSLLRQATIDLLPTSVAERVKNSHPVPQDQNYNKVLFQMLGDLINQGESPLLQVADLAVLKEIVRTGGTGNPLERFQAEWVLQLDSWLQRYQVDVQI